MTTNRIMLRAYAMCRRNVVFEPSLLQPSDWLFAVALAIAGVWLWTML